MSADLKIEKTPEETPEEKTKAKIATATALHEKTVRANPGSDVTVLIGREYGDDSVKVETKNRSTEKIVQGLLLGIVLVTSIAGVAAVIMKRTEELKAPAKKVEATA